MMKRHTMKIRQLGVTLIELMIAIAIGVTIIAGVIQLYATSTKTQRVQDGVSRLQEHARFLFARLSQDVSQTGFIGCFNYEPQRITNTLAQGTNPGELFYVDQPIDAVNGNGPLGTDTLIFRMATAASAIPLVAASTRTGPIQVDQNHPNYLPLEQFQVAMVTNCTRSAMFMITNDPSVSGGTIEHVTGVVSPDGQANNDDDLVEAFGASEGDYPLFGSVAYLYAGSTGGHSYSVGDSAAAGVGESCNAATPEFCALFKNDQELVQGVEDFQLEIGWMTGGNLRYGDPTSPIDWNSVDRIKVTVTLNSIERVPSPQGAALNKKTFVKTIFVRNQLI